MDLDFLPHVVNISQGDRTGTIPFAGVQYTLLCTVTQAETLAPDTLIEIQWLDGANNSINSGPDFTISEDSMANILTSSLIITTLRTSHAGLYSCIVNVTIPGVMEGYQVTSYVEVVVKSEL